MNKFLTKIATAMIGFAMAVGVGVAVGSNAKEISSAHATETLAYTLNGSTAGTGNSYAGNNSATVGGIDWTVQGNATMSPWRLGGKLSSATDRAVFSNSAITDATSEDISKVVVSLGTKQSQITVNSITIKVGTSANGSQTSLETINSNVNASNATATFYRPSNTSWENKYFSFVLNLSSSSSGSNYYVQFAKAEFYYDNAPAKTLSSITVDGAKTDFTVGDTFSFGGTVTAHYSDNTTANVTSSATFSGYNMSTAGNQTVTVSYTEGEVTKTATYGITVAAATTPTITLDAYSFSGYTGQSFSVTASYSNLTSAFAWDASGDGSIDGNITSTGDSTNGTSTYSGTLTGAGTKTLAASGGGATSQEYTINITQTTLDITKSSTSIAQGKTETLAFSHNAGSVDGVTWGSSDDDVATVENGVVSIPKGATVGATATITVTSKVDTSVSDTCEITVLEAPMDTTYDFTANFETYASTWGTSYSSKTLNGKTDVGGDYAATIILPLATKQSSNIETMPVVADQANGDVVHISFELKESGYELGDVSVTFAQWTTKTPTMKLFKGTEAAGDALDSGVIGTKNTISASSVGGTTFVVAMNDNSTSRNQVGIQSIYISLVKKNELDHVTISFASDPADRTFNAGSYFAFNGTLTASYTVDADKAVTPSGYFLEGEEGTGDEITTSTILTVADHNGANVYVQYKEGGITKYGTFALIVNPAPATSVTLSANSGSVALGEIFKVSDINATVNPSAYATQGVTWEVYDSDGLVKDDTYIFDGAEFYATEPADVVFHVKANSNESIYAVFTLIVTGDPIAHLNDGDNNDVTDGSMTVFADAGIISYSVSTENFQGTLTYTWSSSSTSVIKIDSDADDMCDYEVLAAGSSRLSCRIQGSTKGDVTVYVDVTVTAVTVTAVTWTAPTIDVFSGETLSDASGWNVKYSTNSGKTDQTPDSFNVKLGGATIALPHTWVAADNGKTLCVEVGGVSSSTTTVAVTQTINNVNAPVYSENTWSHTIEAKTWSAYEEKTINEKAWTAAVPNDDGDNFGYDGTKGQQFGKAADPCSVLTLSSSDFSGMVTTVKVSTSGASSVNATLDVTVGNTSFKKSGNESVKITASNAEYVFTGTGSGTITIRWTNSSAKALYLKALSVTTVTSSGTQQIANDASHKAAQRAAVAFAKAFNDAMDDTERCTTGLDDAWTTCSTAYTTFKSAAAALGETEEAYALNLIKYATAKWSDDSDEACIERMMRTYKACVQNHSKNAFMSDLVTVSAIHVNPLMSLTDNANATAIIVIISMITLAGVGGYFFFRRRKED